MNLGVLRKVNYLSRNGRLDASINRSRDASRVRNVLKLIFPQCAT